jgi:hypothetical protein
MIMASKQYTKRIFANVDVELDDSEFTDCSFENCKLIYRGGLPPVIRHCTFGVNEFVFLDSAHRTLFTLEMLYEIGLRDMVNAIINDIRKTPPKTDSGKRRH